MSILLCVAQMVALLLPRLNVLCASLSHFFALRNLRHRHIPPRLVTGHTHAWLRFNDNHCDAVRLLRFLQRRLELAQRLSLDGMRAKAAGVGNVIDLQKFAVQLAGLARSFAVTRPEPAHAKGPAQSADARK